MSDLQAVTAVYERVDRHLQAVRDREEGAGGGGPQGRAARQQTIDDQAYFVLAWGQLESDLDEACRDAIRDGQSHEDWRYRRAWSLYNPDDRRPSGLSSVNRLALVLEKGGGDWKRTMQLYNLRNRIAHGTLLPDRIDMASVALDFYRIRASLAQD